MLTFVGRTTKRTTKASLGFSEKVLTVNRKGRIGISIGLAVETGLATGKSFVFAYDDLNKKSFLVVYGELAPTEAFSFPTGTESYAINKKFHAEKISTFLGSTEESVRVSATEVDGTTEYRLYELTVAVTSQVAETEEAARVMEESPIC